MFSFKFIFRALQNYHERHWEISTDTANWCEREKSKVLLESIEICLKLKKFKVKFKCSESILFSCVSDENYSLNLS